MKSPKKPLRPPTLGEAIAIIGYVSLFAGLLLSLEVFLALGRTQYPGKVPPSGIVPTRYLIYAFESSLLLRYAFVLIVLGGLLAFIGYVMRLRNKNR
jgi:hypothetical protein